MAKKHVRETLTIGNLTFVALTMGRVAVVDTADAHLIAGDNWQTSLGPTNEYACRTQWTGNRYVEVKMHRILADAPNGLVVDHIDGNGLNNRRHNLRVVTNTQNLWNQKVASNSTSGIRGVSWYAAGKKWRARICVNGKSHLLGDFSEKNDAAAAYRLDAEMHYGEFAKAR